MNQTSKRCTVRIVRSCVVTLITGLLAAGSAISSPPHPDLLESRARAKAAGQAVCTIPGTADLHARGINLPEDCFGLNRTDKDARQSTAAAGTFRILALMVDFSDHVSQVSATFFDTLVFGLGTGTVHDYFDEFSYGQIDLATVNLPSTLGWTRAPNTYAYYVNNQYGMGAYPQNSQGLVENLVDAVDGVIDFSPYDNDGNGYVDVLLVIHSGTGAELSGNAADFWSHKWGINQRMTDDGVYVSAFTLQPEFWVSPGDMTIGVYSHELLHGFGLPDLYDTDSAPEFVSNGIGKWGVMSYGSWNGSLGSSPSHPCAWSRLQLGVTTAVNVTANISQQSIAAVEGGGSIFRLWTSGAASNEYFLVENRQRTGYDAALPSDGLLIWHIDDAKTTNQDEWYPTVAYSHHMKVALEQADGLWELEHASGQGDAEDCWPGALNRTTFGGTSTPSSDGYGTGGSFVAVANISSSAATMTADLIVGIAAGVNGDGINLPGDFSLEQNYPNPFNPYTSILFNLEAGGDVRLEVFNILGQQVKTLAEGLMGPGPVYVAWDATDDNGSTVATGTYFYRLTVGDSEQTKKMMLVK